MDLDAGTVTGIVGFGTAIVAMLRTRDEAKAKAYADARKDLAKCSQESRALKAEVSGLSTQVDILGRGLGECVSKHTESEARASAIRNEMNELRALIDQR